MRQLKYWLLCLVGCLAFVTAEAHINPYQSSTSNNSQETQVQFREDCVTPKAQIDQGRNRLTGGKVNNVRARLRAGGDPWWDGEDGKYVVPFVDEGEEEVSSIFAGGVWLGGVDPGGNLKIACQTYGNPSGSTDFWTGPLDPVEGTTDAETCEKWDRFFEVYASEIDEHLRLYEAAANGGEEYTADLIPKGVKGWPARGNEFFFEINEFDLPTTNQGLAGFFDRNGNTFYEPLDGDYPVIEIRGCEEPQYPDQMIFWVYNDNGNIHGETNGQAIQMEVQVQAFAYGTNDELNDMTFQRYKLINRAIEDIDSTFFAMWVDADLGCYTDDYIGCDVSRELAYTYNADAQDGDVGITCPGGVPTYGNNIPIVGIDYFRGPQKPFFNSQTGELDSLVELGMSSFTYFNNGGVNNPPQATTDPQTDVEYYRYLSGQWRDGSPFTFGGDAYQTGDPINYAFTDDPNNTAGWSMCTEALPQYDRRTVQASGPFLLQPGAVNELIVGVVWVPDLEYPCPDISRLFLADDLAQNLFDECFAITNGPDAPDVDIIELDKKLILVLTNDTISSNNAFELYEETDLLAPEFDDIDTTYNFEGYTIYQLVSPSVSRGELDNFDVSRPVANVDLKNGILEIYNWSSIASPTTDQRIWIPELRVEGLDNGIRHTFELTEDQFASGNRRLVNHKKYYYTAVAYAYNGWAPFDPVTTEGQKTPYLLGRRNAKNYTGIPRPITDIQLNSDYGDGPIITRLDGIGVGGNFVDLSDETRDAIVDGNFDGTITYAPGRGPIDVSIYNPLEVVDGEFELTFFDEDMSNSSLDDEVRWRLTNLSDPSQPVIEADRSIDVLNEQILAQYGFTINIGQTGDVGESPTSGTNGAIGYEEAYDDIEKQFWFSGVPDDFDGVQLLNYVATGPGEPDADLDALGQLSSIGPGSFVPFQLADHRFRTTGEYITPGWVSNSGSIYKDEELLKQLPNIDVVFTADKSKWSRCVVVETASRYYTDQGFTTEPDGSARQFFLRRAPAVDSVDRDNDGLADLDNSGRQGMGWFPGYAVDVETGKRLNIFFGENSIYSDAFVDSYNDGRVVARDMMWNPTDQGLLPTTDFPTLFDIFLGGQQFIYVTNEEYDGCEEIFQLMDGTPTNLQYVQLLQRVAWTSMAVLNEGTELLSYADGLIPNDLTVKLRVDNPYSVETGTGDFNGYPSYQFTLEGASPSELDEAGVDNLLDMINVVPNPYYGFSEYETSEFDNIVKITNLPPKCVVTIYTLDGKFIRQYNRDETGIVPEGNNRGINNTQPIPAIEWDLKNSRGIPIAGGVYLIHVDAGELGETVVKWFGTNRQFDPSGL